MTPAAPDTGRVVFLGPRGPRADGRALQPVRAAVHEPTTVADIEVLVDGVPVPHAGRNAGHAIAISAWCDTRGRPPGRHRVVVRARWEDGTTEDAVLTLDVGIGEPAQAPPAPAIPAPPVTVIGLEDPALLTELCRTAIGGAPLVLLAPGATLAPDAERRIALAFHRRDAVDVAIGDEAAMIGPDRWRRWRKRSFQPEALPALDQVGPLLAVGPRAADVLADALPAPAGIYGLALELLDRGLQTIALPHVLALTPEARLPSDDAPARAAVERLAARRGRRVEISPGPVAGLREVRWPLADPPEIVAVIPSCTPELAAHCLTGLAEGTDYPALRAVLVDSTPDPAAMAAVVDGLAVGGHPVEVVRYPEGRFNYQRAVNLGAARAGDAHVLFLNDDVAPLVPDWLTRMAELLDLPGVGLVGARLHFPDGRIQHGGVRMLGGIGHLYHDGPGDACGEHFELLVPGNPEAVTGACTLARSEVLAQIGGHDETYEHVFGDVDFCFRAVEAGWRVAWCAAAVLEHAESTSYRDRNTRADEELFLTQWAKDRDLTTASRVWC